MSAHVGIVLVSHSFAELAAGLRLLVEQIGSDAVRVAVAGGTDDGRIGTSTRSTSRRMRALRAAGRRRVSNSLSCVRRWESKMGRCSTPIMLLRHRSGRHRPSSGPVCPFGMTAFSRQTAPFGFASSNRQLLSMPNRMVIRAFRSMSASVLASPPLAFTVEMISSNTSLTRSAPGP
ncbi:hypothetical protein ABT010_40295 [Streptomyces sp. NPDC002668]|uniref:PTS-dependent dihydroxyacetone kinase phosphotransferase subunit DhaM n=1 Tax=Streptomyces sp. NPDC002668 TaxID=3154422 RepID=UPI003325DD95